MAALKDRLRTDLTGAIKARDSLRANTIRMALSALTNAEVAGTQARELSDDEVVAVLATETKKRREAAEAFDAGDRPELADKERAEAEVLADYLPAPLDQAGIEALVEEAVAETGASGMRDMGRVMGALKPRTTGRADGARVADAVKRRLAAG